MSEECEELEVQYEVDTQEVIEEIETEFGAHEDIGVEDDDNIVLQEEVVIRDDNSSVDNEYEEPIIEFEENDINLSPQELSPQEMSPQNTSSQNPSPQDLSPQEMSPQDIEFDENEGNDSQCAEEGEDGEEGSAGEEKVGENEVYQWSAFTGLRVKTFTAEELAHFRKPFDMGWKREVVLRGTVTSSGKKIGDVYYFSPDKKTKLRSYVEMGLYLKRSGSPLLPENFTFARQPIYRPPAEIVRHAMQRGGGQHQVQPSQIIDSAPFTPAKAIESDTPAQVSRSARTSTASESEEQFSMSIAEGRAKRKRVAPTRFEDEDYAESPFKKKTQKGPPGANGSQQTPVVSGKPVVSSSGKQVPTGQPKQQMSLQEKRRQLQHQLYQQVHEKTLKQKESDFLFFQNCLTPEDCMKSKEAKVNGQTSNGVLDSSELDIDRTQLMPKATHSMFVSTTPLIIQPPAVKPRSTFAAILPKTPQLSQILIFNRHLDNKNIFKCLLSTNIGPMGPTSSFEIKVKPRSLFNGLKLEDLKNNLKYETMGKILHNFLLFYNQFFSLIRFE